MSHRSTQKHLTSKGTATENFDSYFNVSLIDFLMISPY
jgi:hypothetical protein